MRDVDTMILVESEMLRTRSRIILSQGAYMLNNKLISGQVVRDMINDGWIYEEETNAFAVNL